MLLMSITIQVEQVIGVLDMHACTEQRSFVLTLVTTNRTACGLKMAGRCIQHMHIAATAQQITTDQCLKVHRELVWPAYRAMP